MSEETGAEIKDVWRNIEKVHNDLRTLALEVGKAPTREELVALHKEVDGISVEIENIRMTQELDVKERHALELKILEIKTTLEYIKVNQDKMMGTMSRITWIVLSAFLSGLVVFVLKGGLVI